MYVLAYLVSIRGLYSPHLLDGLRINYKIKVINNNVQLVISTLFVHSNGHGFKPQVPHSTIMGLKVTPSFC